MQTKELDKINYHYQNCPKYIKAHTYFSSYPITVLEIVLTHFVQFMVHFQDRFVGLVYYPKIGHIMLFYFSH